MTFLKLNELLLVLNFIPGMQMRSGMNLVVPVQKPKIVMTELSSAKGAAGMLGSVVIKF